MVCSTPFCCYNTFSWGTYSWGTCFTSFLCLGTSDPALCLSVSMPIPMDQLNTLCLFVMVFCLWLQLWCASYCDLLSQLVFWHRPCTTLGFLYAYLNKLNGYPSQAIHHQHLWLHGCPSMDAIHPILLSTALPMMLHFTQPLFLDDVWPTSLLGQPSSSPHLLTNKLSLIISLAAWNASLLFYQVNEIYPYQAHWEHKTLCFNKALFLFQGQTGTLTICPIYCLPFGWTKPLGPKHPHQYG